MTSLIKSASEPVLDAKGGRTWKRFDTLDVGRGYRLIRNSQKPTVGVLAASR
jgi:hypothetical protein